MAKSSPLRKLNRKWRQVYIWTGGVVKNSETLRNHVNPTWSLTWLHVRHRHKRRSKKVVKRLWGNLFKIGIIFGIILNHCWKIRYTLPEVNSSESVGTNTLWTYEVHCLGACEEQISNWIRAMNQYFPLWWNFWGLPRCVDKVVGCTLSVQWHLWLIQPMATLSNSKEWWCCFHILFF